MGSHSGFRLKKARSLPRGTSKRLSQEEEEESCCLLRLLGGVSAVSRPKLCYGPLLTLKRWGAILSCDLQLIFVLLRCVSTSAIIFLVFFPDELCLEYHS